MSSEIKTELKEKVFWSPMSFDADGVLIDNQTPVLRQINRLLKTNYKLVDVKNYWSSVDWFVENGKCKIDTAHLINQAIWSDPQILLSAYPMPGACEFMRKLYQRGLKPSIVSIRKPSLKDITVEWFGKWMPWISKKQICIQEPNSNIPEDEFKPNVINVRGICVHFEDSLEQSYKILDKTGATILLVPHEYNKTVGLGNPRLIRIPSEGVTLNINKTFGFLLD